MDKIDIQKPLNSWYNFRTGQYEYIDIMPTDFTDYLPQTAVAICLYKCRLEIGESPLIAYKNTMLAAVCGKSETE